MIEKLRTLNNEESTKLLRTLTTKALKKLAQEAGISVAGSKDTIIGQIVNHFGFKRLNEAMKQRPAMQR
jgi:hypothetical protein